MKRNGKIVVSIEIKINETKNLIDNLLGRLEIEKWLWTTVGELRQQIPPATITITAGTDTIAAAAAATADDELSGWD